MSSENRKETISNAVINAALNMDGVYTCIKDEQSKFVFCNDNFANLVGSKIEEIIDSIDNREEHVADDKKVRESGIPLLNHREIIELNNGEIKQPILTQKGLWRDEDNFNKIIGTTVNFVLQKTKEEWVKELKLIKTDNVGYFAIDEDFNVDNSSYSMNYILIDNEPKLKIHKLEMDEQWFFHDGAALEIYVFDLENKTSKVMLLGNNFANKEKLQLVVPKKTWFGAKVSTKDFNLSSCSLSPKFYPGCSELINHNIKKDLLESFPDFSDVINELS